MGILALLKPNPRKRLERMIRAKSGQAMQLQRNGKLREFAALTREVALLERQLVELERSDGHPLS